MIYRWPGIEAFPLDALTALVGEAEARGWDANALLGLISHESRFNPAAKNPLPNQTASGLIQMIESSAQAVGTTTAALRAMSAAQQVPFVFAYYDRFAPGRSMQGADFLKAGFGNGALGGEPSKVIGPAGSAVYKNNKALDRNQDGQISVSDLESYWAGWEASAAERGEWSVFEAPAAVAVASAGGSGGGLGVLAFFLALGLGVGFTKRGRRLWRR